MQSHSDTVYKVIVCEHVSSDGLGTITLVGQLEQLGEQTLVRCGQVLHDADGWYVDRAEADRDAAEVIEARAARLAAQAERMRAGAG
jgi:hypothetical protein